MRSTIVVNVGGKKYRREKLEGRDHLVVPIGMMTEGVLNGSGGKIYYPADEIEASVDSWNGMPIVVDHPIENDEPQSARSTKVYNERKIGVVMNSDYDGKLRCEGWFDEELTKQVDKRVHNAIVNKKQMEVSTGLDLDLDGKAGEWNGQKFDKGTASNLRPDHLAILPDKVGACSVKMGAGLYANSLGKEPEGFQTVMAASIQHAFKRLGITVNEAGDISFGEISRCVADKLAATYGEPGQYWRGWIVDTYPDYVIFYNSGEYYKQSYTVTDGVCTLDGDAVQVRPQTTYVTNQETIMPFEKKKFVDKLIANGDAAESDRDNLMKTDDKILSLWDVTLPTERRVETVTEVKEKTKETKEEPATATVANSKKMTEEEWLAAAPKSLKKVFNRQQKKEEEERTEYVKLIVNSKSNKLTQKQLENLDTDVLENMAAVIPTSKKVANEEDDEDPFEESEEEDEEEEIVTTKRRRVGNYTGAAGGAAETGKKVANEEDESEYLAPVGFPTFDNPRKKR